MKLKISILALFCLTLFAGCKKADPPAGHNLPAGATPYTEADMQFVPYSGASLVYKRLPLLDSTLTLTFKERLNTEEYFAWDQTYFTYSSNPALELELRLRYLQTDNSQKTLAIYMPYRDSGGEYRTNIFEMPINPATISTGFFQNHIIFHDTIVFNSVEWYDVLEVKELLSTDPDKDGPENYDLIYYNTVYGIIRMNQNNGTDWLLQQ